MKRPTSGDQFTNIVLSIFRLNGALVAHGDRLVDDLGLSTSRWQVLGMIVECPRTVSAIARRMGLSRQSVQRTADRLVEDGYATTSANPDHQSAKLYVLTAMGQQVMAEVNHRKAIWANRIAHGVAPIQLEAAQAVLQTLLDRLESESATRRLDHDHAPENILRSDWDRNTPDRCLRRS